NANVSISWTLLNGRSLPLIQNAYDMVDASKLGFEQAEGTLLYATSLAYLNIVTTCEQMRIRKRGLQIARQHRELALARKEVGDASEVMVLRAEVEVATANQIFLQAQNSLKMAKRSLATLMGMIDAEGDFSDFRVERKKSPTIETPKESSELIALAYQDRLDLKIAKLELKMSERFENETWMKFLPSVVGTGSWRWSDAEGFSGEKTNWQLGLAAQWLLFEGGNTYWELKERGHEIRASQLSVENKKLSIAREVRDAMEERDNARTNYEAAQVRVTLARKSALLVRTQYELGGGTQLEVLDANRAEADAETAVSIARLVWDIAEFGLAQIVKTPL
ncbi:TolC family protein, partial [Myxococcota bacterium]|nr:TolC family protein [Myxococcota bacterium]